MRWGFQLPPCCPKALTVWAACAPHPTPLLESIPATCAGPSELAVQAWSSLPRTAPRPGFRALSWTAPRMFWTTRSRPRPAVLLLRQDPPRDHPYSRWGHTAAGRPSWRKRKQVCGMRPWAGAALGTAGPEGHVVQGTQIGLWHHAAGTCATVGHGPDAGPHAG